MVRYKVDGLPYGLKKDNGFWYFRAIREGGGSYYKNTKLSKLEDAIAYIEADHFGAAEWDGELYNVHAFRRGKAASDYGKRTPRCEMCGWQPPSHPFIKKGKTKCHVHHILPISNGGNNSDENLVSLCPNHHYIAHRLLRCGEELTKNELLKLLLEIESSAA